MDGSLTVSSIHGVFQQGLWSGLSFPPPGHLPNPGIKPMSPVSPALQAASLPLSHIDMCIYVYIDLYFKKMKQKNVEKGDLDYSSASVP